jgi:hypothetical protein
MGNIKHLFPQRQWWGSPEDVRPIPHQTPKCFAPIYQAKQSGVDGLVGSQNY